MSSLTVVSAVISTITYTTTVIWADSEPSTFTTTYIKTAPPIVLTEITTVYSNPPNVTSLPDPISAWGPPISGPVIAVIVFALVLLAIVVGFGWRWIRHWVPPTGISIEASATPPLAPTGQVQHTQTRVISSNLQTTPSESLIIPKD